MAPRASRLRPKRLIRDVYDLFQVPVSIWFLLDSSRIHPAYRMSWWRRFALGLRMFWNTRRVLVATSYKNHLMMGLRLLEMEPGTPGDVIECGAYKGGSATNLSLVCRIVGRKLRIYDSFKGLPAANPEDRQGVNYIEGEYCGTLDEVKRNITRFGAIECCEFVEGWFSDTLPHLESVPFGKCY